MTEIHENSELEQPEEPKLSPSSTVTEVFNVMAVPDGGVQVVPVTIHQDENDTRLAIFIRGEHEMASIIMARLMVEIDDLSDLAAQRAANPPPKSRLVIPK